MAKKWPLSIEELQAAKALLYDSISFADIVSKYSSRVEESNSSCFTHKCTCPNPQHKNGNERTPSFHFSEKDKGFVCFGCGIQGEMFDFLSIMEGSPWHHIVRKFLQQESIDLSTIDLDSLKNRTVQDYDYLYNVNLHLSVELRNYLESIKNSALYEKECEWVDRMFRRIDDRLGKLSEKDFQQAHSFESQILYEIDRRKSMFKNGELKEKKCA